MRYAFFIALWLAGPLSLTAQSTYAIALYNNAQYDSAILVYTELLENYPQSKQLYYNRGLCYGQSGQLGLAINDFDAAVAIDSLFKEARYAKARALYQTGQYAAAINQYRQLYAIDKNYNALQKRIKIHGVAVYLSRNWYYMVAMAVLVIIFLALVVTYQTSKKGL